jgi:tetratricopeptide (TPR) repeat protein
MASADELFEARHFPGVVALVSDALDETPDCIPLLLLRARAHIALRRDLEAQTDLREIIRLDPQCGVAYRLIGEVAARRDENESAAIFFREALRLDPGDEEAHDWLMVVAPSVRPAAVAQKLPAPATAAGRFPRHDSQPRFAKGTQAPDEERATQPYRGHQAKLRVATGSSPELQPLPDEDVAAPIATKQGAQPIRRPVSQAPQRGAVPELPGFGEYLVSTGILTRERLRAAQAYQRSMKVQLSTAIVTLGLATPQRIEWAAVAHQSQLARER